MQILVDKTLVLNKIAIYLISKIILMKRKLFLFLSFVVFSAVLFIACNTDEQDGITVGYASENTSTGGNPDNTTAATAGGATTSTSLGSTSTTGSSTTSGTTSGATTVGSTTTGSTTSTTSGSTTTPPVTTSWFKMNGVTYNCSVTNPIGSGGWIAFGNTGVGDTCLVMFNALPVAGNYSVTSSILNSSTCSVGTINSSGLKIYGMSGTVTVSVVSATRRRVVFNLTDCIDGAFSPATMSGDLTTP